MHAVKVILQVVLGLAFLAAGGSKLAGVKQQVDSFNRYGYPQWFRLVTGAAEIAGGVGLFVGIGVTWLAALAGLWLVGVMAGALVTHLRIHDRLQQMLPPLVLLVLAAGVAALRWSALSDRLG
jgi:putative oxidoreductase